MIVLLTGQPGIGKSTVVERFVHLSKPAYWVITKSIPREDGWRAGFEAFRSDGKQRIISHKTDIDSPVIIGKNHVDLAAVNEMFAEPLRKLRSSQLTVIDEIGPIQLLSADFKQDLSAAFSQSPGPQLLATIHYNDPDLEVYRTQSGVITLSLQQNFRDNLPEILALLFAQRDTIDQLSDAQRNALGDMLQNYLEAERWLQIDKLLNNAVGYVKNSVKADQDTFVVSGKHGSYTVKHSDRLWSCTCDLYNGKGEYAERAGECSHIQTVKLWQIT